MAEALPDGVAGRGGDQVDGQGVLAHRRRGLDPGRRPGTGETGRRRIRGREPWSGGEEEGRQESRTPADQPGDRDPQSSTSVPVRTDS